MKTYNPDDPTKHFTKISRDFFKSYIGLSNDARVLYLILRSISLGSPFVNVVHSDLEKLFDMSPFQTLRCKNELRDRGLICTFGTFGTSYVLLNDESMDDAINNND